MEKKKLAERILGAVLVCSFGFILYSAFLDSEGANFVDRNTQIPPQSRFLEPFDMEEPEVLVTQPEKTAQEIFIPTEEVDADEIQGAGVLDEGRVNAWVIQVGSFSTQDKASEIRDQLMVEDYRAYHRELVAGEKPLYRVLIGPYMNAEEAVRHQRSVDELLNISTLLMKFEP